MGFIQKLNKVDLDKVNRNRPPLYRVESIVWASEGSATLDGVPIGDCQRLLYYKFMGVPETNRMPLRVQNICDSGLMHEDHAIDDFKKLGLYVDEQIRMEHIFEGTANNVKSSGKMDVLICEDGINKGIEIKTISSYKVAKVFGDTKNFPLPAEKNLIQAMNYKKRAMEGPVIGTDGVERQIDEVYLMYIDRGTKQRMFFKVELDNELYGIITPIDQNGKEYETIRLQDVDSFEILKHHSSVATSDQSRLASLRFSLHDIGAKYDSIYNYVREEFLPPKDYNMIYDDAQIDLEYQIGRVSKVKYNKHYPKTTRSKFEAGGDMLCSFCNYRDKCLADDGIHLT